MTKRILLGVAALVALIALLAYSQIRRPPDKVSGFIEADEIRLGSRVGGRVENVLIEEGQHGARKEDLDAFIVRQAEVTPSNVQTPEQRSKQVVRIKVTLEEGAEALRPGMAADVWLEKK